MAKNVYSDEFIRKMDQDIDSTLNISSNDNIDVIEDNFYATLHDTLKNFTTLDLDNEGFLKRLGEMDLGSVQNKNMLRNILNDIRTDKGYVSNIDSMDLIVRRDIHNVCKQMPEMWDVITTTRDAIVECDVVTGKISRSYTFVNNKSDENDAVIENLETNHKLGNVIKNFIIPQTLMIGEMYVNVVPYSKLFAELDHKNKMNNIYRGKTSTHSSMMSESLFTESNVDFLEKNINKETVSSIKTINNIDKNKDLTALEESKIIKEDLGLLLKNISVSGEGTSVLMQELGYNGMLEYLKTLKVEESDNKSFFEANLSDEDPDYNKFKSIKGCYVKYLDSLNISPIRLDRKIAGYLYVTKQGNPKLDNMNPSAVLDISLQSYTRDKKLVDSLANIIIKSFDKEMLNNNIQLKSEISEIIMAHKFSDSKLSFLFIPDNEIVRFAVNEDENGKGHSMIEPALFPARMYLLLTMYNMLHILNNSSIKVHYLKSSGLNKDYASNIQRTMRKFQQRRINVDDINSYTGVLNKIGGISEMVLPTGKNDFKAIETDTIPASTIPIELEFLEQQRRQAITATGVPALMIISALDEVDFAKVLEMANTRFLSTVSSYKIDFNDQISLFYKTLLTYETDLDKEDISSFEFKFNSVHQPGLNITNNMINDFNVAFELVSTIFFTKDELEDSNGKPTNFQIVLKKHLAKKYLPQLEFDELDNMVEAVRLEANEVTLRQQVKEQEITDRDIDDVKQRTN